MSYQTIAVHVDSSRHCTARVALAAALAVEHGAHLVGVGATAFPQFITSDLGAPTAGSAMANYLREMRERVETELARFEAQAGKAGALTFERRLIEEETGVALCLQARYSDLLVIGQRDPDEALLAQRDDIVEYVITHSPCPVLTLPYASKQDTFGRRIVVAWDGSAAASHALRAAMPLLKRAAAVQVVVFDADRGQPHGEQPGADVALFIARHGVKVEVSEQTSGEIDTGNALLSYLADHGADLLVMGGYGHARFTQILVGGVTRTMLRSMTVPVLLAH